MSRKLYIFDMDGTLIPNTTACLEIARHTNTIHTLKEMEANLIGEKNSCVTFAKKAHETWGVLDKKIVKNSFVNCPKLMNIKKTTQDISQRGDISCIITLSPHYFAEQFYDFGFDYIFSSKLPDKEDDHFEPEAILSPEDKVKIAQALAKKINCPFEQSVFFGDSFSDLPLMNHLTETVAVNGNEKINRFAKHAYQGQDLWEAYQLTRTN